MPTSEELSNRAAHLWLFVMDINSELEEVRRQSIERAKPADEAPRVLYLVQPVTASLVRAFNSKVLRYADPEDIMKLLGAYDQSELKSWLGMYEFYHAQRRLAQKPHDLHRAVAVTQALRDVISRFIVLLHHRSLHQTGRMP